MAEWRDIANTGGAYQVSADGQVRSVDRVVPVGNRMFGPSYRRVRGRVLAQFNHPNGYRQVCLMGAMHYVHQLVLVAFTGNKPDGGHEVDHVNGDRADNRAANLRWVTKSGNQWNRVGTSAVSGERGLTFRADRPKLPWHVRSGLNGRSRYVGAYATKEQAISARDEFERQHRG